jgi:hypothetical protein
MGLQPKRAGAYDMIDADIRPPCGFIAGPIDLAVMASAQRNGELMARLATERAALCEPGTRPQLAAHRPMRIQDRRDRALRPANQFFD